MINHKFLKDRKIKKNKAIFRKLLKEDANKTKFEKEFRMRAFMTSNLARSYTCNEKYLKTAMENKLKKDLNKVRAILLNEFRGRLDNNRHKDIVEFIVYVKYLNPTLTKKNLSYLVEYLKENKTRFYYESLDDFDNLLTKLRYKSVNIDSFRRIVI